MGQVKVFGVRESLVPVRERLGDAIHGCLVEALGLPADKRFHRFFPLDADDFPTPPGRSQRYTIIET